MEIDGNVEACQKAFSTVCAFIGTRDLIQDHIAFRVWPLVESWDMPKETTTDSSEGGLVRLKYTFRFREKIDELDDDWHSPFIGMFPAHPPHSCGDSRTDTS